MTNISPSTYAIIPARGGSKGLPRKNIRLLGGIPLIAHSIKAALDAQSIDRVVVTTEDQEIASVARDYGAEVIVRPQELATDTVQNNAVVRHALDELRHPGHPRDIVVLLQPTSPLRRSVDIDGCVDLFRSSDAATAMTVCDVDVHPGKYVLLSGNEVEPYTNDEDMEAQRQNMISVYRQNGAVYVVGVEDFLRHGAFYRRPCVAYRMGRRVSIDIDEEIDLQIVESIIELQGSEE